MAINVYKSGAFVTDDLPRILQFQAQFLGGLDRVCHLRLPFTTVGYQVTAGKTLYITKLLTLEIGVTNPAHYKLGYADNDVGFDTVTARTNPVMSIGVDDGLINGFGTVGADAASGNSERNVEVAASLIKLSIASKFPFIRRVSVAAGGTLLLWGFEA